MIDQKIIFITHYTELYGANRSMLNLIDGLSVLTVHDILVLAPKDGEVCTELKKRNIPYRIIPFVNEIYPSNSNISFIKKIAKLFYNWLITIRYASSLAGGSKVIIHSNSSATLIGAYFAFWLRAPHVWHIREFGNEDYNFSYNFGYRYFNFWLNKANTGIAISRSIYEKRLRNCSAVHKLFIYNGVAFLKQLSQPRQKTVNHEITPIVFGIIGLIKPEKGQAAAIEAFGIVQNTYKDSRLIIAGNGDEDYIQVLKAKVKSLEIETCVLFTGFIKETDEFYDAIDCLLMCSKQEALGRVTIEAMASGVPVIGYNNGGTGEIIKNEYNGFLYSEGAEDLSEKMKIIISNEHLRNRLGKNARQSVIDHFTIEAYSKSVYEVYASV